MAAESPIGYLWLKQRYGLETFLTHQSYLGSRLKTQIDDLGNITDIYPPTYGIEESAMEHVEFGIKYDHLSLDLLKSLFTKLPTEEIVSYIHIKPKGVYQRRIGYLFEFLTGMQLPIDDTSKVNYVDLIDPDQYITGKVIKVSRWAINDNLPGTREFSPIIRRTKKLNESLQADFHQMIRDVTKTFSPAIFHRAVDYLYKKETKSSYQIEREEPTPDRMNRFVSLLETAGEQSIESLLNEKTLTEIQNTIVDPRFAAPGYRGDQNFISSTNYNFREVYHYISPPPHFVASMMEGLATMAKKSESTHAIVQAAAIAFGFVFIHPFEDGNGRIHRFLIHDFLIRNKLVEKGMIIPVSAHMVNHIGEYDQILENYSKPLMKRIKYEVKESQSVTVTNADDVEGYYRYPDLTEQVTYLANIVNATITEDIFQEMDFLQKYDETKSAIQNIVDMPDRQIDQLIRLIHNNRGTLSKRKRDKFEKLTDDEIKEIEKAFQEVFELP
jgi:Fic/DOC family